MPYAENNGVRIHYQLEGGGQPLVLQHGFTDSLETWYELGYVDALKPHGAGRRQAGGRTGVGAPTKVALIVPMRFTNVKPPKTYRSQRCTPAHRAAARDRGWGR